ncbi:hypothetical protein BW45_06250 [Agrobacterium tumefaciens]|nr:hypothetical protein BW45_06250 [Agrobacterium tumefaciens]
MISTPGVFDILGAEIEISTCGVTIIARIGLHAQRQQRRSDRSHLEAVEGPASVRADGIACLGNCGKPIVEGEGRNATEEVRVLSGTVPLGELHRCPKPCDGLGGIVHLEGNTAFAEPAWHNVFGAPPDYIDEFRLEGDRIEAPHLVSGENCRDRVQIGVDVKKDRVVALGSEALLGVGIGVIILFPYAQRHRGGTEGEVFARRNANEFKANRLRSEFDGHDVNAATANLDRIGVTRQLFRKHIVFLVQTDEVGDVEIADLCFKQCFDDVVALGLASHEVEDLERVLAVGHGVEGRVPCR